MSCVFVASGRVTGRSWNKSLPFVNAARNKASKAHEASNPTGQMRLNWRSLDVRSILTSMITNRNSTMIPPA